ncbi:MAG: hypothetical protein ACXIVG_07530 [Pararhodobacter sp.]
MSAPDTNLQKQKRRHWGPLLGIATVLVLVAVLFFAYLGYSADTDTPEQQPAAGQVDPEVGQPAEGTPATPLTTPDGAPQVIEPDQAPAEQ